jgi:hypothetical protein
MAIDQNDALAAGSGTDEKGNTKTDENTNGKSNFLASIPSGSLIGTDFSKEPELELRESHINALRSLLKKLMMRDMPARREEILRVWEAELFWRGYQHLLPSRVGFGWEFAGPGSGYGRGEGSFRSMFETNFYLSYGRSVISALTRKVPTVRFIPICPQSDIDITSADAANKLVGIITRNNKMLGLMAEMARFLYTDGRASFYTRYVRDGQRFGFKDEEEQDEEGIVPENEEKVASGEEIPEKEQEAANTKAESSWPEPCGREVITVHGALEVKYPIKANYQSEVDWLLWSCERDLPVAKGMYPKKADKIVVSRGGPAGDDVDRLARINTKLGVEDNFITSDSEAYDVTIQNAWLRDCALLEITDDQTREELIEMSRGKGIRVTFCGNEFIEAKKESLDDHWTLIQADAGDGIHRASLGQSYIPIQKVVNNLLELANDYFVNGIPTKWMDNDTFNVEHIKDQTNTPGGIRPFTYMPGVPANELVWYEPVIQFPTGLAEMIEDLGKGQTAQILTGIFPALSGDDTGNNDTGIGMKLQRDAALGRLGIPWRNIKEGISCVMLQAVQCLAKNHDEDIVVSGLKEGSDAIMVELGDLKGKYYCEPDTDENFPESYTEIQNRIGELIGESVNNPALLDIVNSPENYGLLKRGTGLSDIYIPKECSYNKQLGELEELKKSGPLPNPALAQMQEQLQQLTAGAVADPQLAEQATAMQQQISQLPPTVSSVEIDEEVDDHATEAETCLNFLRGSMGRAMKNGMEEEQAAYENIKMHYLAHAQAAAKIAENNKKTPEKGITKSVTADGLIKAGVPPEQAIEIIKQL